MPTLRPRRSWVKVWMASTKSASSGDSLSEGDMPSNSGPAGSRPGSAGNVSSKLYHGKSEKCIETYTGQLTCNPSNFLWTFQVAPSKSRDVCSKAVANQMNLLKWVLIAHLLELHVLFIGDNAHVNWTVFCTDIASPEVPAGGELCLFQQSECSLLQWGSVSEPEAASP